MRLEAPKFVHESSSGSSSNSSAGEEKPKNSDSSAENNKDKDSVSSSEKKHSPVVLKLSKQDNGTYYKSASSAESSPRKDHSDRERGSTSGNSSSSIKYSASVSISSVSSSSRGKEMQRKGSSDSGSNVPDSTATFSGGSKETNSSSGVSVKLESVDGDEPNKVDNKNRSEGANGKSSRHELAISALKSSCSVTLDKAKVEGHSHEPTKVIKLTTKAFGSSNGDSPSAGDNQQPMDFSSKSSKDSSSQEKSLRVVESTTADSSTISSSSSSSAAAATGVTITAEKRRSGYLGNNDGQSKSGVTIEPVSVPKQEPGVR